MLATSSQLGTDDMISLACLSSYTLKERNSFILRVRKGNVFTGSVLKHLIVAVISIIHNLAELGWLQKYVFDTV